MGIGLTADAAFARWKQAKKRESLSLYADVLSQLEFIPVDENLHNRQLHATVRHSLAWINSYGASSAHGNLEELPPGACSNPDPHEGLKDLKIIPMAAVWGLLGNIDTRFGTGLGLTALAEEKYKTQIPIIIRLQERFARYEALWKGDDFVGAVPRIVGLIEINNYQRQLQESGVDVFAQFGEIPHLDESYWSDASNRGSVLCNLLSLAIFVAAKNSDSQLPLDNWRSDLQALGISGPDVDTFFGLLTGKLDVKATELVDEATVALHKIRVVPLSPQDLFACHFRLLNLLVCGDWGLFVGDAFSDMVARHWLNVAENQQFALRSPSIYGPLLQEKCRENGPSGYAKSASILETAAIAAGANVAESGKEFLMRVKTGEFPVRK